MPEPGTATSSTRPPTPTASTRLLGACQDRKTSPAAAAGAGGGFGRAGVSCSWTALRRAGSKPGPAGSLSPCSHPQRAGPSPGPAGSSSPCSRPTPAAPPAGAPTSFIHKLRLQLVGLPDGAALLVQLQVPHKQLAVAAAAGQQAAAGVVAGASAAAARKLQIGQRLGVALEQGAHRGGAAQDPDVALCGVGWGGVGEGARESRREELQSGICGRQQARQPLNRNSSESTIKPLPRPGNVPFNTLNTPAAPA